MAEKLDAFPQARHRSEYPLDDWLDGSAWALIRGGDFDRSLTSMRTMLASGAKARGLKLRSRRQTEGEQEVLVIQAHRPLEDPSPRRGHKKAEQGTEKGSVSD
jgi:hypothetical protein